MLKITPDWDTNRNECIACARGSELPDNPTTTCAFIIEHTENETTTQLCLHERKHPLGITQEETEEFIEKYGISNISRYFVDFYADSIKYCKDKGYRVPTRNELVSIAKAIYDEAGTTIVNQELFDCLATDLGGTNYAYWSAEGHPISNSLVFYSK